MSNQRLFDLYKRHESAIYSVGGRCAGHLEGPFLTAPHDAYWLCPIKVAFVGQQTKGWYSENEIAKQMDGYSDFHLGKTYYSSPFWNVIRKLENALAGVNYSSAWLNFNRYDQDAARPSPENERILSEIDFIVLEELKIISANVVVFLTGPGFYDRINILLQASPVAIKSFPLRQICELESPVLGGLIFRTYHPNYLRRSRLEPTVVDAIGDRVERKRLKHV